MSEISNGTYLLYPLSVYDKPVAVNVVYEASFNGYILTWNVTTDRKKTASNTYESTTNSYMMQVSLDELKEIFKFTDNKLNSMPTVNGGSTKSVEDMEEIIKKIEKVVEDDISITADQMISEVVDFTSSLANPDQITFTTNLRIALDCYHSGTRVVSNEDFEEYNKMKTIIANIKEL